VPLRLIDLVHVTTSDSVQVFFRLKDFIDLTPANRFQVLDLSGTIDVGPEAKLLMFPISDETIERLHVRATPPSKLWDRLTDDSALPPTALRNFAGSLVLRIESLTAVSTGVALQPKRLEYRSHRSTWGFELRAHETYECSFAYNRLKQGDAEVRSRFNYAFASPPEFFETSLPIVPVYGGYRRDSLWITPLKGLPAPVFLEWHGNRGGARKGGAQRRLWHHCSSRGSCSRLPQRAQCRADLVASANHLCFARSGVPVCSRSLRQDVLHVQART
jgi:hypothetical protein